MPKLPKLIPRTVAERDIALRYHCPTCWARAGKRCAWWRFADKQHGLHNQRFNYALSQPIPTP